LGQDFCVCTAKHILQQGLQEANQRKQRSPNDSAPILLWSWHGKVYLGAAHGVVGILQTLLYLHPEEWQEVEDELPNIQQAIQATIDYLIRHGSFESGNLQSSLCSTDDRLVHWCHGAPGMVLLLHRAAGVYSHQAYLEKALEIAEKVLWPRGLLKKGLGLCHGISGNGMVLLRLCQEGSGGPLWRQRALAYAKFAVEHWQELEAVPDRPYSLYEGLAGFVCFLLECSSDSSLHSARFPMYEH
jgi:lantibiotic modifying enzyme